MTRSDLIEHIITSNIFTKWHWFRYHFNFYHIGLEHPFAASIVDTCIEIENVKNGYGVEFIDRIASISGKEKFKPHYEQLLQILCELLIIRRVLGYQWGEKIDFRFEPSEGKSKKNPEISIKFDDYEVGIEVKAPSLLMHQDSRVKNELQIPGRSVVSGLFERDKITLPRDNPIKDFLLSANEKFSEFKKSNKNFIGLLVIVWDDHIYEPITSFVGENSGIFTEKSFTRDDDDNPLKYENIDAVIIIRHLHQLRAGSADLPLMDNLDSILSYGADDSFPFKIIIPNPFIENNFPEEIIEKVKEGFNVFYPSMEMGAEYIPSDLVLWI